MTISAAQCRAGRALLDWTQDQLATNAQVARATIADFERNIRMPMRNNLVALRSTLEAAGVEMIDENGGGAGVRLRKVELEYSRDVNADSEGVTIRVRYRGTRYRVRIPSEVIQDMDGKTYTSGPVLGKAVERQLPIHLRAAEEAIIQGQLHSPGAVMLDHEKYPPGTFQ